MIFKGKGADTTAQSSGYGSGQSSQRKRSRTQRAEPHRIIKMTTIRSETGPRDTDEERLYVVGSDLDTNRDGSP